MKKWLVPDLEQKMFKMSLEHLITPKSNDVIKKNTRKNARVLLRIQKAKQRGPYWPKMGQLKHD